MVNESDAQAKDDATVETYVEKQLRSGLGSVQVACMTFDEERLYPLDHGLNKVALLCSTLN